METSIGLIFTSVTVIIGLLTFYLGRQSAAKKDGLEWGSFQTELKKDIEYIKRDVSDIKVSFAEGNNELKASVRRIHKRIDDHLRNEHMINVVEDGRNDGREEDRRY